MLKNIQFLKSLNKSSHFNQNHNQQKVNKKSIF